MVQDNELGALREVRGLHSLPSSLPSLLADACCRVLQSLPGAFPVSCRTADQSSPPRSLLGTWLFPLAPVQP